MRCWSRVKAGLLSSSSPRQKATGIRGSTLTLTLLNCFPHLLLCILFSLFSLSTPPFPRQFSSPKSPPGTSDLVILVFLVEKRQLAGPGFGGRFWTGSPHRKKGTSFFFSGALKEVSFEIIYTYQSFEVQV